MDANAIKQGNLRSFAFEWWPLLVGLLAMYVPTFFNAARELWSTDDQAHGPIILATSLYLLWQKREAITTSLGGKSNPVLGGCVFAVGLLFYIIGRSQQILIFEIGSLIWVFAAIILLMRGGSAFKALWFPLFFMLFMIPLPGTVVDGLTMPMKMAVSYTAEHLLSWLGYPIGRAGVILQIAQYKLMVADACAGLHTLFALEAMGLLYLNVVRHNSVFRNVALAILIVPISFTANVIRVILLTLITYYFGDEAGQGFVHGFAGIVLFFSALTLIISVDSLLRIQSRGRAPG